MSGDGQGKFGRPNHYKIFGMGGENVICFKLEETENHSLSPVQWYENKEEYVKRCSGRP